MCEFILGQLFTMLFEDFCIFSSVGHIAEKRKTLEQLVA